MAKVERKTVEPMFEPVVITIESQPELDYFTSVVGHSKTGDFKEVPIMQLFKELQDAGGKYTTLTIKKG